MLIVDDERGVRALLARWVRELGYAVDEAESADEALERFAEQPAAVVLCDVGLPTHDGHWLVTELRARGATPAVVMVTGQREVGTALNSLQHGFVDYLVKPFGRDRLREALARGLASGATEPSGALR